MLCTGSPGKPCSRFLVMSRAFDCGEILESSIATMACHASMASRSCSASQCTAASALTPKKRRRCDISLSRCRTRSSSPQTNDFDTSARQNLGEWNLSKRGEGYCFNNCKWKSIMHNPRIPHHLLAPALQCAATMRNALQHTATHCNALQHAATHCNTRQHTATHCNTLQHTRQTASQCKTCTQAGKEQPIFKRSSKIDLYSTKTPRDTHEQHIIQNKIYMCIYMCI